MSTLWSPALGTFRGSRVARPGLGFLSDRHSRARASRKENGPPCEWASLIGNKASQTVGSIPLQPRQFYGGLMNTARPMLGHRMALTSGGLPPNAETVRTILCEPTFAPPVFTGISRGFKQLIGGP